MSARVFVPGRIEVLGKHTDYAGGSSLLVAVERGFIFEAGPLDGGRIVIAAEGSGEDVAYTIWHEGNEVALLPDAGAERPHWACYVDGVLQRTIGEFGEAARGVEVRFRSDLPVAAGLSSSSALVTGTFLALDAVCRFHALPSYRRRLPDRQALAGWLSAAEMGGPVGTRGGSEDHVAILCAEPGRIVRYGLAPVRYRGSVPVPDGWTFAVGVSGVVADKGGAVQAHYNRLSDLAVRAAQAWSAGARAGNPDDAPDHADAGALNAGVNLGSALERSADADALLTRVRTGAALQGADAEPLLRRTRHFLQECALVDAAYAALECGDVKGFATAANRSAALGAELLRNQVPETLALARVARELGAPAASPFGGGFGGAVWALTRSNDADAFLTAWRDRYHTIFPERTTAQFFTTPAGGPAIQTSSSLITGVDHAAP